MQKKMLGVVVLALFALAGCRHEQSSITGSYGSSVISGEVTMASGGSPAGVTVGVAGTGMSTVVGEDGRFVFANVPENAELTFRRADGIDASLKLQGNSGFVPVSLAQATATASSGGKRRAGGQGGPKIYEYEGVIQAASATELTMLDSHGETDVIKVDATTVIKHGDATIAAADLKPAWRIHVKATITNDVKTAVRIEVQNMGDDDDDSGDDHGGETTINANGLVTDNTGGTLKVQTVPNGLMTVKTDANTVVKKQGTRITVADIKTGDQVNSHGTKVDATTLLAREIEVRGASKKNND